MIYWSMFYGFGVGADAVVYVGKSAVKSAFNILLGVCVKLLDCPVISGPNVLGMKYQLYIS